jgi:Family of unknown function (DUF5519)
MCFRYLFTAMRAERSPGDAGSESVGDRIVAEVGSWDRVTTGPGRFGSIRFVVGRRELGHLHGATLLDLPLPPERKRELLEEGRVAQHRYTPPKSGWVSLRINGEADRATAIELLREQYDRAIRRHVRAA